MITETNDDANENADRYNSDELADRAEEIIRSLSDGERVRVISDEGDDYVGEIAGGEITISEREYEDDQRLAKRDIELTSETVDEMELRSEMAEISVKNSKWVKIEVITALREMGGFGTIRYGESYRVDSIEVVGDGE